jgi:glycosyltransferase involved in cell wall biosynthesis
LTPRVSVVVASYNHANFIGGALGSVLSQTYQDFEIVVVDDGSTDDSVERIRALGDKRITLTALSPNTGACIALNRAIRASRGEFIAVLNSDDEFLPEKLERQVGFLDANANVAAVFGWPELIDEGGAPFGDSTHKDYSVFRVANRARTAWLRHFFDEGNCLCHPTLMIRRGCYADIGLYDARLAQLPDLDFWVRLTKRHPIHVLSEAVTRFRIRAGLQNASAARPETVIRDAWERRQVLNHFLSLSAEDFHMAFPEYAGRRESIARLLANRALGLGMPFYVAFALDAMFMSMGPHGEGPDYRAFHRHTGRCDLFGLYAGVKASEPPQLAADSKPETRDRGGQFEVKSLRGWLRGLMGNRPS